MSANRKPEARQHLMRRLDAIRQQRDELLTALRRAVDMIDNLNAAYGSEEVDAVSRDGRAAIAKATGTAS